MNATANGARQYDLCQRYRLLAAMLTGAFPSGPVRVLDVGAGTADLGRAFLPERFLFTLADTMTHGRADLVLLQPGAPLPFAAGAFDAVVAMDVLEHVPPAGRDALVAELARVTAGAVLLSHPTATPAVVAAEAVLADAHRAWFGVDNEFLREHAQHGLPDASTAAAALQAAGLVAAMFPNCPLVDWLPLTVMDVALLAQHGLGAVKDEFNAAANTIADGLVVTGEHYRMFVVGARAPAMLDAVRGAVVASQRLRREEHGEAVALLLARGLVQSGRSPQADGFRSALAAKDLHIVKLEALLAQQTDVILQQLAAKDEHIGKLGVALAQQTGDLLQQIAAKDEHNGLAIAAKDEHIRKLEALLAQRVGDLLQQLAAKDARILQLEHQARGRRIG